jgi:uncharacterized membrane protein YhaH (DUF805 family)
MGYGARCENDATRQDLCVHGGDDNLNAPEIPSFFGALRVCLVEKYFRNSDRASRREFWFFALWLALFALGAAWASTYAPESAAPLLMFLVGVVPLFFLLPLINAIVRRLHDVALPFWTLLAVVLPPLLWTPLLFIGAAIGGCSLESFRWTDPASKAINVVFLAALVVLLCWPGTKGPNKYGPAPAKGPKSAERPFSSAVSAAFAKLRSLRPTSSQDAAPCPPNLHSPNSRS